MRGLTDRLTTVSALGCCLLLVLIAGCVTPGGEVVRVITVEDTRESALKEEDRARLEEIRKETGEARIDENLNRVLKHTPQLSISEYLARYPESVSRAKDYKVGGYDVLSILVYEEEDLTRDAVRVSGDGYISFPLVGRLHVDGLTTSQIEVLISRKLAEGQYMLDAHVSVMVKSYESKRYLVLGSVKEPGSYSLRAQERLLDAISRAGGLGREQRSKRATVVRTIRPETPQETKVSINVDLEALMKHGDQYVNIFLTDKDTIYIAPPEYFYIMGEVNGPGSFMLPEDEISLVEAIGMAGGFTKIADRNKTRIIRVEDGREKVIEVKVDAITEGGKKIQDVPIKAGDVIVVPESFF